MDGVFATALAGKRPGTALHAPQVRIVTDKGEPLMVDGAPVSPDIVSSAVTLPASGTAVVDIVLNNQRNEKANSNRPAVPSWRYNALKEVSFGKVFRVDYRYGQEPWTPMILARITGVDFNFPSAAGAQVTLKGEDFTNLLKVRAETPSDSDKPGDNKHELKHEDEIVRSEVEASAPGLKIVAKGTRFSKPIRITRPAEKTRLEFVREIAERMDYELFVAFGDNGPIKDKDVAERPVEFHFEPANSDEPGSPLTLVWGRDIIDFKPTFSVWDVPTEVTALGAKPPPDRGEAKGSVTYSKDKAEIFKDLHPRNAGTDLIDAVAARTKFFAANPDANALPIKIEKLDDERARRNALAAMRKGVRSFLTAELSTLGLAAIRPRIHVELQKLDAPFDGIWYITQAVHTINASGYISKISLRRPGMLDPSLYPRGAR